MFYSISRTLEVLPYLSWLVLGIGLILLEVKNFNGQVGDGPTPDPSRNGFIPPPGDGYEYYMKGSILYIVRKGAKRFRVYIAKGDAPDVKMKQDRYGRYFSVRSAECSIVEKIIEKAYR